MTTEEIESLNRRLDYMHDGDLWGVTAKPGTRQLSLYMRDVIGVDYVLTLDDVESAATNNFRQGNIIESVESFDDASRLDDNDLAELAESTLPQHLDIYRSKFAAPKGGRPYRVLKIGESYGGRVLAVFAGDIRFSTLDAPGSPEPG